MDLRQCYSIHYRQASDLGARGSNEDLSNQGWGIVFPGKVKHQSDVIHLFLWEIIDKMFYFIAWIEIMHDMEYLCACEGITKRTILDVSRDQSTVPIVRDEQRWNHS